MGRREEPTRFDERKRSPPANSERVFSSQDATCIGKLLFSRSVNTFSHSSM